MRSWEELELLVEMDRMELIEGAGTASSDSFFVVEQTWDDYIIYKFRHRFYKDYVYQHLSMGEKTALAPCRREILRKSEGEWGTMAGAASVYDTAI